MLINPRRCKILTGAKEERDEVGGPSQHAERVKGTLSVHMWTHKTKISSRVQIRLGISQLLVSWTIWVCCKSSLKFLEQEQTQSLKITKAGPVPITYGPGQAHSDSQIINYATNAHFWKSKREWLTHTYLQSCFTPTTSLCFREEGSNIYCGSAKLNCVSQDLT